MTVHKLAYKIVILNVYKGFSMFSSNEPLTGNNDKPSGLGYERPESVGRVVFHDRCHCATLMTRST